MSDSLLDNLLNDSQTNYLKEKCPSLFNNSGIPKFSYNNILSADEIVIPDGLKYYQMVENGNSYVNDLLDEEEKYLKEKYGESLYKYFVTKREKYINNKMKSVCSSVVSQGTGTITETSADDSGEIVDTLIVALRQQLNSYEQSLKTYNEVSRNNKKMKENKFLDARKFYYQSDAMDDVGKIDMAMTAFYYIVLISSIIYLTLKGRAELKKKWLIYLLLILLPLVLSKIYGFFVIRFVETQNRVSGLVPKKAFLNQM